MVHQKLFQGGQPIQRFLDAGKAKKGVGTLFTFSFAERKQKPGSVCCDLVESLNVVVGQVEENQTTEATESPLPHMTDVAALHGQVSQVRGVSESPRGQLLDVVASKI